MPFSAFNQNEAKESFRKIGLRGYIGRIFVHSEDVENTSGSNPVAIEVEYSKRHIGETVWDLCRCYPTTGLVAAFHNYDNKVLGYGAHLAYFVQYHFFQNTRISPTLRGLGGLSYNSNPYQEDFNPDNRSYSLPINFSLQVALGIEAQLTKNYTADVHFSFNHISNGGIQQPNKGINWPALGLGFYYVPDYFTIINRKEISPKKINSSTWFNRFEIYASAHSRTFEEKERFAVLGSELLLGYYLSNLNVLSTSLEWNYDYAQEKYVVLNNKNKSAHRISLNTGHEFVLGDFRFTQKAGIYLFDQLKENDLVYHKWGIIYLHKMGITVGVELKAHRHVAEVIVGKIGYQF